jgi:GrpB-like predicted nucleotidyltransferase (UPF0157 family)
LNEQPKTEISPYDDRWPAIFRGERAAIAYILADVAVRIDHIGSTSVAGLDAKPVIDIQAEVRSLAARPFYDEALRHLDFESIDSGENDIRVAMRKRSEDAADLHIVKAHSWAGQRTILFRDALRSDPALVQQHADLKRRLAGSHVDIDEYTSAKTDFVEDVIESRALAAGLAFSAGNRR